MIKFAGLLLLSCFALNTLATNYDVRTYGAKGDGITIDTRAINDAIDAASLAGGGTVYFPAGAYLAFSIHLRSNTSLYIDQGAVIKAADAAIDGQHYDDAEPNAFDMYQDFGHSHWHNSLLWGEGLINISILGPGTIDGKALLRGGSPANGLANKTISLKLCRNVILRDFTIVSGGHFAILATGADNLTIDNLKMDTNRDGMDIDCCQAVHVSNCSINSPWDDAICLKSSYALGYAKATQDVTINDCFVSGYDLGTFINGTYGTKEASRVPDKGEPTGRIKFGTESNGGFKNITVTNCVFEFCRGLALETVDGALLEDITISNITMRDIVNAPIFLRLGARLRGPAGTVPGVLRRVLISNILVYNANSQFGSIISGIPGHDIEDVELNNIRIWYRPMDSAFSQIPAVVPENEQQYPEPYKMGIMPAYGFFIRHVKGITLNNVEVGFLGKEIRPAFYFDDVQEADIFRVKAMQAGDTPRFIMKRSNNIFIRDTPGLGDKHFGDAADVHY